MCKYLINYGWACGLVCMPLINHFFFFLAFSVLTYLLTYLAVVECTNTHTSARLFYAYKKFIFHAINFVLHFISAALRVIVAIVLLISFKWFQLPSQFITQSFRCLNLDFLFNIKIFANKSFGLTFCMGFPHCVDIDSHISVVTVGFIFQWNLCLLKGTMLGWGAAPEGAIAAML